MSGCEVLRQCLESVERGEPVVLVTLVQATGSTPQDDGAKMAINESGRFAGTVGGGRVEAKAIEQAQQLLRHRGPRCTWVDWNLKADVGMTCGGRVKLVFEYLGDSPWQIAIFGAGHVSQSLCRLLATLSCHVTCIDSRVEWLTQLPIGIRRVELPSPADYVPRIPNTAYVLCMTQGHHSDLPVLAALLSLPHRWPFVGVIGSRAKAAVLRKELAAQGIAEQRIEFHCPVGLPIGTNDPAEIAVSIAAQLLKVRDQSTAPVN